MGNTNSEDFGASANARLPDAYWFEANPFARMSFSRFATYGRCPAWYRFKYIDWHRTPVAARMRVGHVVQDAVQDVLVRSAPDRKDADALQDWAVAEATIAFDAGLTAAAAAHEADPNATGPFDVDRADATAMVERAFAFHFQEVRARLEGRHPRTGEPLDLPTLDSAAAAWEAVRPTMVFRENGFPVMEVFPSGYFQGEFDLVYSWTGGRRIIDLKASTGTGPFSGEVGTQLAAYALLDRELGRGRPAGLEAWFLGRSEPEVFPVPPDATLDALDQQMKSLVVRTLESNDPVSEFPAEPTPPAGSSAQNVDDQAWCRICPFQAGCPRHPGLAPSTGDGVAFDAPPTGLDRNAALIGTLVGVGDPRGAGARARRRLTFVNSSGLGSFGWDERDVQRLFSEGLKVGVPVRIAPLMAREGGRGGLLLTTSEKTRVTPLDRAETAVQLDLFGDS